MTLLHAGTATIAVFIWALVLGSVAPTLVESWRLGGPGARVALDVEMSREWIAMTGSAVIPERMQ